MKEKKLLKLIKDIRVDIEGSMEPCGRPGGMFITESVKDPEGVFVVVDDLVKVLVNRGFKYRLKTYIIKKLKQLITFIEKL